MGCVRRRVDFASLQEPWTALLREAGPAAGPFVSPQFYASWWSVFADELPLDLVAVEDAGGLAGVLPLTRRDGVVTFVANHDVTDYMDFVAAPGREAEVVDAFFEHLDEVGANAADLRGFANGTWSVQQLQGAASERGWRVQTQQEAVCPVIDLPATWDAYLESLRAKDRREVRRKLRVLRRMADSITVEVAEDGAARRYLPVFLRMMADSRGDKAAFLTEEMATFFRTLVANMADAGYVRLYLMRIAGEPAAGVLTFVDGDALLLYNSGYDPRYEEMSAGLASKVLCVRDAIERGMARVNFLRGDESYKFQLGARPTPVTRLQLLRERS